MRTTTRKLTAAAVLSAIAILLMQPIFEIPIPFLPPWLKIDLSGVPVLLAGFGLGPVWGIAAQVVKSLAHIPVGTTGGIGEVADLLAGCAIMLPAALIYRRKRTRSGALLGLCVGILSLCVVAALSNYYLLVPVYFGINPNAAIAGAMGENSLIQNMGTYILYGVIPFNILKGVVVSAATFLLYKRVRPLLHKFSGDKHEVLHD